MRRALCIGINAYDAPNTLSKCVNDALAWRRLLETLGYDVELLLDKAATRDGILAALKRTAEGLVAGDDLAITYSGHGASVADSSLDEWDLRDEAIVPVDLNLIVDDEIAPLIGSVPAAVRLWLVSDSCHSQTQARSLFGGPKVRTIPWLAALHGLPVGRRLFGSSRKPEMLLSGCKDPEFSYEAEENGAMTAVATATFERGITPREWIRRIRKLLPNTSFPQTPVVSGGALLTPAFGG
jgi:hypothetical protein